MYDLFDIEQLYIQGLKYTWSCTIINLYQIDEDNLIEELIGDAFGC